MSSRLNSKKSNRPKLISLFTGAGGLDLGLEEAGFDTLVVNEIEAPACETLRANKARQLLNPEEFDAWFDEQLQQRCYSNIKQNEIEAMKRRIKINPFKVPYLRHAEILEGDIRELPTSTFLEAAEVKTGEIDLIAGGPPCQPFSRAGKRQTVECETGRLFMEFVRLVNEARPRWFVFENVKGLVISKTEILDINCSICKKTTAVSFEKRQNIINNISNNNNCPNCGSSKTEYVWRLERGGSLEIIINEFERLGYKCYWKVFNAADFGVPQIRERLFIVGSRDGESFEWPSATHTNNPDDRDSSQLLLFNNSEESQRAPWKTIYEELWSGGHPKYGHIDRSVAVLWVKNVVRPHDEPVTWSLDRPSPTIGAHQGAKLALAPQGVPEAQLLRQQWHVLGRRQRDLPPVFVEHEYLSDEELLRLQTFPAGWYLFGTRMQRAFQIGNAVPPALARAMGSALYRACGLDDKKSIRERVIEHKARAKYMQA